MTQADAEKELVDAVSFVFGGFAGRQEENLRKAIAQFVADVRRLWQEDESRRQAEEKAKAETAACAPPPMLLDIRKVYSSGARDEDGKVLTVTQQAMRRLLKDDPKAFLDQMAGLEKAWAGAQARKETRAREVKDAVAKALASVKTDDRDVGSEKALELAEKLLEKLAKEVGDAD